MKHLSLLAALLVLFGSVVPAEAQRTTGEIVGKVVDESGGVLPGVTVTLKGAGVAGTPSVVTGEAGTYRFPVLPAGTYSLQFALAGFGTTNYEEPRVAVCATL